MSNLIPFEKGQLPAWLAQEAASSASELTAGVGAGFPVMSIKGKVFALVSGGERTPLMNPNDNDEPATSINVVILKANPKLSKVFYASGYTEGSDAKPDCFSHDGERPDPSVEKPQCKTCAACPKNEWGSKITEDGKKGKACADSRRIAIANVDDIDNPILLRVPAATLRPLAEYGQALAQRNVPYSAVLTKIGFDRDAASPKLTFKATGFLEREQYEQVKAVAAGDVVASILGKAGEAPVADAVTEEDTAAAKAAEKPKAEPKAEAKPAKAEKPKAEPKPEVTADEVEAAVETKPKAEKPKAEAKPAKAEPKVAEGDNLEDEIDNLLSSLDD